MTTPSPHNDAHEALYAARVKMRAWLITVVAACSSPPTPRTQAPVATTPDPVAVEPAPTPPELRLPADVVKPTRQEVELVIDPASEDFSGTTTIAVDVEKPTKILWLNAVEIVVERAVVKAGSDELPATAITPKDGYLGLQLATQLPTGKATLVIRYRAKSHHNTGSGLFTVKERDDWYAFTQFENTYARQAFPCFDEPSFKIPWRMTIRTKKPLVALANAPVESETDEPDGMKVVRFVETKPLPSYLVAFAVGPFEAVDAGTSRSGVPIRIVVPKGRTGDTDYPVKNTKRILDALEDYFGIPYPYPKLDALAVPGKGGAMENPGLITYAQPLLVTRPEDMTRPRKEAFISVAAHEMSHQWFGDMVTMAWWDDTWLNESFATWMEVKITAQLEPSWEQDVSVVETKNRVMGEDSLDSARQIRQPIVTANDIANAFDDITYSKGEAVLTMIERHLTAPVFQRGVRAYLAKHMWGSATYDDFVGAMVEAAGVDEKPLFDSFVLQSGVPVVSVKLDCTKGDKPKLVTSTRRYKPIGSTIDPKRTWTIPMCVRWGAGNATGHDCATLTGETSELALSTKTCPEWVLPNDGELGYFRVQLDDKLLRQLLAHVKALTVAERVGVVGDVNSLINSGDAPRDVALGLVADLAKSPSRHVVDQAIVIANGIDLLVPAALRANYERFIVKTFGARARDIGWHSKPGEDDNTTGLRPQLLTIVANPGNDAKLIAKATELAWKWFADHKAIQPELVLTTLTIAARHGDQKLFDTMHAEAKAAKDREDRRSLLRAMAAFRDPKIVEQVQTIGIGDEFELRERFGLLTAGLRDPTTREASYGFLKSRFDEIAGKLPPPYRAELVSTFATLCDKERKPEIEGFFKSRFDKFDGGPRVYQQVLEEVELCDARKRAQTPSVEQFLKRQ